MKTTLIGLLTAVGSVITTTVQGGHSLLDWKTWIVPACFAAFGYFTHDKPSTP